MLGYLLYSEYSTYVLVAIIGFQVIFWLLFLSDSILGFSLDAPCYFTGFTSWSMKAVKGGYERRQEKKRRC